MGQGLGPVPEGDAPDPRLVEQDLALIGVEGRHLQPRAQVDPLVPVAVTPLDDRGGGVGGEPAGVEQVVVGEDPDHPGPLERSEEGLGRAADGVVEGEQPRGLARAPDAMREGLSPVGERPDREGRGDRHVGMIGRGGPPG